MRVVDAGLGSLIEVQTEWVIEDLNEATEYLDVKAEAEEFYDKQNK